jgi:Uma2 family endonuclease
LRSLGDSLKTLQEKIQEYIDNGTCLAWLIDRITKKVEVYRQVQTVEILDPPMALSGENILHNFVLYLQLIW